MASTTYFENLADLADIDIDMEVKSEHDSDEEMDCSGRSFDSNSLFGVEFIIPEQQKPDDDNNPYESMLQVDSVASDLSNDFNIADVTTCDTDEDLEDEPEVSTSYLEIINFIAVLFIYFFVVGDTTAI